MYFPGVCQKIPIYSSNAEESGVSALVPFYDGDALEIFDGTSVPVQATTENGVFTEPIIQFTFAEPTSLETFLFKVHNIDSFTIVAFTPLGEAEMDIVSSVIINVR